MAGTVESTRTIDNPPGTDPGHSLAEAVDFVASVMGFQPLSGALSLFDVFSDVASMKYEERTGVARIVRELPGRQEDRLYLDDPVSYDDVTGLRKLLEVATPDLSLCFSDGTFWGFAASAVPPRTPSVCFLRHGLWGISPGMLGRPEPALYVLRGRPVDSAHILNRAACRRHMTTVFGALSDQDFDAVWSIIETAVEQKNGTNVLFTPAAAGEAERLSAQCIRVSPKGLNPALTQSITTIDGTAIVDLQGQLHAAGAIMDGPHAVQGAWQRGGRYNSAVNYVAAADHPAMILVVSQDGGFELIPPVARASGAVDKAWPMHQYVALNSTST